MGQWRGAVLSASSLHCELQGFGAPVGESQWAAGTCFTFLPTSCTSAWGCCRLRGHLIPREHETAPNCSARQEKATGSARAPQPAQGRDQLPSSLSPAASPWGGCKPQPATSHAKPTSQELNGAETNPSS